MEAISSFGISGFASLIVWTCKSVGLVLFEHIQRENLLFSMPSFESLIIAAPAGFSQGCADLNSLVSADASQLEALVGKSLAAANFVASDANDLQYAKEIKVINFIVRCYKGASPLPTPQQMASALDLNTLLTRETVEKIIVAIQSNTASSSSSAMPLLSQLSGKLLNLKWRVGVAVSSSKCKNLSAPYVLLNFDVKEVDGSLTHHSTELSYDQFKDFKAAFERVATAMDGL